VILGEEREEEVRVEVVDPELDRAETIS